MTIPFYRPEPAPAGAFNGRPIPINDANPISRFFYHYAAPMLKVGYSRPLEPDDMWDLTDELYCQPLADEIEAQFMACMPPSRRTAKYQPIMTSKDVEKDSLAQSHTTSDSAGTVESKPNHRNAMTPEQLDRQEDGCIAANAEDSACLNGVTTKESADVVQNTTTRHSVPHDSSTKGNPEYIKTYGKKRAKAIAEDTLAIEEGELYDMNLTKAIFRTVWREWLISVMYAYTGNLLRITSPLVTRVLLEQITRAHEYHNAQKSGQSTAGLIPPRSIGYMIGVAIALPIMLFFGTTSLYQSTQSAAFLGCRARAAVIDLISRKSMRLSGKSRLEMTNGRINTMVSADASYLDWALPETTAFPVTPVQILTGIALLSYTLGYSALVGLGVLMIAAPFQGYMFKKISVFRQGQEKIVDQRVKLLSEIINNIRSVKLYAYERHFGARISELRSQELAILRRYGLIRSAVVGTFAFTPILAAVLTFITYALSGHTLDAPTIFTALQFFNILRNPITYFPMQISIFIDALSGMKRIGAMFRAEELREEINIDPEALCAVNVLGDFRYESASPPDQDKKDDPKEKKREAEALGKKRKQEAKEEQKRLKRAKKDGMSPQQLQGEIAVEATLTDLIEAQMKQNPFELRDINLKIPAGSLVCIVGRVSTGKSALLGGMINEMRQTRGHVIFGGSVSYVPQQAWVQSGSIRDNITFSSPDEDVNDERVEQVIDACGLRTDIAMWQDGVDTKIGEKGITLSGGQRQRSCIARAAYDQSEIVLLDDPLSAVDAHVGHHLLEACILSGPLAARTRILVTHHLDVLPRADLVLVMDRDENNEGRIIQQGTYTDLLEQPGIFKTLIEEFGSSRASASPSAGETTKAALADGDGHDNTPEETEDKPAEVTTGGGKLIMDEDRNTGSVDWHVYTRYCRSMGSLAWVWLFLGCLIAAQIAAVGNTLFLGYWSSDAINGFSQGQYMAIYAGFGLAIAILTWAGIYSMILAGIRASFHLFNGAFDKVVRSPTSWHDRTPTGRIISRFSKDIEMLDDKLMQYWNQFLNVVTAMFGALGLILYTFPYLGILFVPLTAFYYLTASYYRHTSRKVKRVESLLRSHVYSSLAEQLAGLSVIRAFGQQSYFQRTLQDAINTQNRATVVSIITSRWLYVRLEGAAELLTLGVGLFGVGYRYEINPARFGVVLIYVLATTSTLNTLVPTFAVCEREMNNVERIQHYIDLETEAEPNLPDDPKDGEVWPTAGKIDFEHVKMQYRPDLPLVLKGLTFSIKAGEKVGVIGRTGTGKSSVAQALFRTVELCEGKISVDGRNLKELGLETLRQRLAIIPQDAFVFAGTVRENIDPTATRTDAELNDALNLIQRNATASHSLLEKFKLEAPVLAGGTNFSAGEAQLLALMRALARNCKVLLLDEATSSVDPETDALIQRIIQTEFADVTLISIAHRLQTVAYYDRILVLDAGTVAEFDTPLALFDNPNSIFRSLCQKKDLTRADLLRIQQDALNPSIRVIEA